MLSILDHNKKFVICSTVLVFQDQLDHTNKENQWYGWSLIEFIQYALVKYKNVNPTQIVYITKNISPDDSLYKHLHSIHVTSKFFLISGRTLYMICLTCGKRWNRLREVTESTDLSTKSFVKMYIEYGDPIYFQHIYGYPWNNRRGQTCTTSPDKK